MSHLPNWQEYGLPAAEGGKVAVEIHCDIYGYYKEKVLPPPAPKSSVPQNSAMPFVITGSK